MKKLKVNPVLIYLLIMVFIVMLYYFLIYTPLSTKTNKMNEQNYNDQKTIQTARNNSVNIDEINKDIDIIENDLKEFDSKLDFGGKMPPVLDDINTQATKKNITIKNLKIGNSEHISKTNERLTKTIIDVTFTGSNEKISTFIKYFEECNDKFYIIELMNLIPVYKEGTDIIERYDCSIKLAVFYYTEPLKK